MVKKRETDNSLIMVAVVAIVAIVVLVTSIGSGNRSGFSTDDILGERSNVAGQAGKFLEREPFRDAKKLIVDLPISKKDSQDPYADCEGLSGEMLSDCMWAVDYNNNFGVYRGDSVCKDWEGGFFNDAGTIKCPSATFLLFFNISKGLVL